MEPIFIKNFLPNQMLNFLHNYCILKFSNKTNFLKTDVQSSSLIGQSNDFAMETLLDLTTPVIENNVNKKLWPTYSFLRIYDKGSDLKAHKDRPSCEYTVALCLGSNPVNEPYEIFLGDEDKDSSYKYYLYNDNSYSSLKITHKFEISNNDALIFQGTNKLHWREYCTHDYYIAVFLHYVEQTKENEHLKYDGRSILGANK